MPIVDSKYWPAWQVDLSREYEYEDYAVNENGQRVWGDRHYVIYWEFARAAEDE